MTDREKVSDADLIDAAKQWDKDRKDGKRPVLVFDAVNYSPPKLEIKNDDTRKPASDENPFDPIIKALGG